MDLWCRRRRTRGGRPINYGIRSLGRRIQPYSVNSNNALPLESQPFTSLTRISTVHFPRPRTTHHAPRTTQPDPTPSLLGSCVLRRSTTHSNATTLLHQFHHLSITTTTRHTLSSPDLRFLSYNFTSSTLSPHDTFELSSL